MKFCAGYKPFATIPEAVNDDPVFSDCYTARNYFNPSATNMPTSRKSTSRTALTYLLLIGMPMLLVLAVIVIGRIQAAPAVTVLQQLVPVPVAMPDLVLLLAQVAMIITCARLAGQLFRRVGQPQVVGEMAAGIALGPTLLGSLAPGMTTLLFPPQTLGFLQAISQLGMIVFMFVIGLELDPAVLRERKRTALLVSLTSIALPFALGVLLAYWLYPHFGPAHVEFTGFALFIGISMSVTAFPVLAHILKEQGLSRTSLGALALTCAALNDVAAWLILAAVVLIVKADHQLASLPLTFGAAAVYLLVMLKLVRPLLARLFQQDKETVLSRNRLALILVLVLCAQYRPDGKADRAAGRLYDGDAATAVFCVHRLAHRYAPARPI